MNDIKRDLKKTPGDLVHSIVKTGISAIPVIGGGASELFSLLVAPPASKRRDQWLEKLAQGIEELKRNVPEFDVNSLKDNDIFITTVLQATHVAIRNHQEEKLIALRNAVLNSAIGIEIDENIQLMFLNMVDSLTPWHLRILTFFQNPSKWFEDNQRPAPQLNMGSPARILEAAYNELNGKREFYDIVINDLNSRGLLGTANLYITMSGDGALAQRTTDFGDMFVSYISPPC
ncbi:hypothetical protein PAALTS15_05803 [Paenibacillus alvei TS-15]|uniref:Uncharacterized protein n=1 Tax=Paenibacillus alvei TS-15 TaxID=1117108 RepID=S9SVQ7_PAEAL|nr:hypothetical protein [Paenibacillus alvei]EPY08218.1 hypothetical protein PAALTS15_05803 [Paenibacillus alvei TS-15]